MKLKDITITENKKEQKGTYAGVRFDAKTLNNIRDFTKKNNVPNVVPRKKIHTTLLYSRKYLPNYEAQGEINPPMEGQPLKFEVWDSQPDDDGNVKKCLVLSYKCDELTKRHNFLMKEHKATYDYDSYKPHITFSYDVGDFDYKNLPAFTNPITIVSEYKEDLNLDWNKK